MRRTITSSMLIAFSLAAACAAPPAPATTDQPGPLGDWLVEDKTAHIRIQQCGEALWGIVSWLKDPNAYDENNPDPAKRARPILGLPILLGMKPKGSNRWDGEVYDAEDGKIYNAHISLKNGGVLRIEGCGLGGLVCSGEDWTRLPPPPKTDPLLDVCKYASR